ncbi:uncharacterized protein DUF2786 [Geodermatophilus tzadiensis]|uniref:Uncharacterized protein DUF2786 n=1 Tax=Geodermatophilus tzadiensis TaxID=1137988 RepID=A0A2T0T3F7_9ACTN|nr:DUF2786 domain-containing protein [Geodermatophilus tzadiensis]PRY40210.1 uncharacterized protein DUF2786 [Geodermatophilus tzadiensis]
MRTPTADDAWLRDLLLGGDWRPGGDDTDGVAGVLAARDPGVDASGAATGALLSALADVWERGWQPADVAHAVGRGSSARTARLAVALVTEDARATDAASRAPEPCLAQLGELGALTAGAPAVVAAWHRAEGRPAGEAWREVLRLATTLRTLPRVERLVPPPSAWGAGREAGPRRPAVASPRDDARVLRRIRALLAKAESTDFPEEAEALTGKAQELMTRYAVDTALLDGGTAPRRVDVATRRVHVVDPYVRAKVQLLDVVARANGVRLVWYPDLGIATLVGVPADLDAVELLFTSLLLQAGQALGAAERAARRRSASRSFRRAFLLGYAGRVGERLTSAREQATRAAATDRGVDLLPVLRSRQEAVDEAFTELFPGVRSSRSSSSVDGAGWWAGRSAAEAADVGSRHLR